jgi:hypothetical protein
MLNSSDSSRTLSCGIHTKPANRQESYYNPQLKIKSLARIDVKGRMYGDNRSDYTGLKSVLLTGLIIPMLMRILAAHLPSLICSLRCLYAFSGHTAARPRHSLSVRGATLRADVLFCLR